MRGGLRQTVHRLAQRYRACEAMRVEKQEFVRRSAAMENKPSWRAYRAAYAHTRCSAREYFIFRFYEKSRVECDSYLTLRRRDRFIHQIGDDETSNSSVPGNKILFNRLFEGYLRREWLNLAACTPEEFAAFVRKHGKVMLKPACGGCGKGISLYRYEGDAAAAARHAALAGEAMLAEEMSVQHAQLNRLNPHCLNTVRVVTYTDCDEVHIVLATLRSAKGNGMVDNFHAGGICMAVDLQTGAVTSDGMDEEARVFSVHPLTGTPLRGFRLPNWEKAMDVVRRAAREMYALPRCRFLGWDVAFLENGEVAVIECNWRQGVEAQMPHAKGIFYELEALRKKR